MNIIGRDEKSTIKYCSDSDIYYIFYDFEKAKFYHPNSKEINKFSVNSYNKMEIYKPNNEMIKLFQNQEESNDLTLFKKYFLGKKRDLNKEEKEKEEEEENNKKYEVDELNKLIIKTDFGYKNTQASLTLWNLKDIEQKSNKLKLSHEENNESKIIPKEWYLIFKSYNTYKIMVKQTQFCNSIFTLPFFYKYKAKYLIIKNKKKKWKIFFL